MEFISYTWTVVQMNLVEGICTKNEKPKTENRRNDLLRLSVCTKCVSLPTNQRNKSYVVLGLQEENKHTSAPININTNGN